MRVIIGFILLVLSTVSAQAFCGFYVARADGALYNEASKIVFMRDKRRSVITMSSDYQGPAKDFAMIVPTPKILNRDQVRTVKTSVLDHLDAYTAPRLVEYHDYDPCDQSVEIVEEFVLTEPRNGGQAPKRRGADAFGVKIRAQYAVGIYDIVMLSADQSDGLTAYLRQEGYKIPDGAEGVLADYIKAGMKFFVARVNLKRLAKDKAQVLEPLQISFRASKFMLPLQLGKVNAKGPQDVLLMTLTRTGAVEAANYRTQKIPTDTNVPTFVKDVFGQFYKKVFDRTVGRSGVVMEYAWDMAWCDPCAADPLSDKDLKSLGVHWLKPGANAGQDVFVTRLHLRYDKNSMKQDLMLKHTRDRSNFQGRYVMNHPFVGDVSCEDGREYVRDVRARLRREAVELNTLTGWSAREIERRIRRTVPASYW